MRLPIVWNNLRFLFKCNAEMDIGGVDLKIGEIEFAIYKVSQRKEARSAEKSRKSRVNIPYAVYNADEYARLSESPRVSEDNRKKYKKALAAFKKYFYVLENGFVVFSENYVLPIAKNLSDSDKLNGFINNMLEELSGE